MPKFERPYFHRDSAFPKLFDRRKRSLWAINGVTIPQTIRVMLRNQLAKSVAVRYSTLLEHSAHAGVNLMMYFSQTDDNGATVYIPKDCGAIANFPLALGKDVSPVLQVLPRRVWPAVYTYLTTGAHMDGLYDIAPLIAQLGRLVVSRIALGVIEWDNRAEGVRSSLNEFKEPT